MSSPSYFLSHQWLIPLFPLITAALMLFIGRLLPKAAGSFLCVGRVLLAVIHATGAVLTLMALPPEERVFQQVLFEWVAPGVMPAAGGLTRFVADCGYL